jgi:p-aminobenzoyl-glutamate transporter AbgT
VQTFIYLCNLIKKLIAYGKIKKSTSKMNAVVILMGETRKPLTTAVVLGFFYSQL